MYWTVLGLVLLLPIIALAAASALAKRPSNLGVRDGRLSPCPASPNCVCSQATDDAHRMEPISFQGPASEAMTKLKQALAGMPRMKIVQETEDYLHVEPTTLLFRFVDDVEFYIDDAAKMIHYRSASRIGHSDLGANRARMERVRERFNSSP